MPLLKNEQGTLPPNKVLIVTLAQLTISKVQFSSTALGKDSIDLDSAGGWRPAVDSRQQHVTVRLMASCSIQS